MNEEQPAQTDSTQSPEGLPPSPSSGAARTSRNECGQDPSSREDGPETESPDDARPIETDILCPSCSYNLRGLTSNRCPECGLALDAIRSHTSQIPWVHRKQIGWYRAYWKTVWYVMTRRRQMSTETARPISYGDAQKFRMLTVLHAYLPILAATVLLYIYAPATWTTPKSAFPWAPPGFMVVRLSWPVLAFSEVWPVALLHVGFLLWLVAGTGVASYFFHPRDLPVHVQNRAVALSYYASAALAWTFLPVCLFLAPWASPGNREEWSIPCTVLAWALLFVEAAALYLDSMFLLARTIPGRAARLRLIGVLLPLLWLVLAVVLIPGVFAIIFAVLVVVDSLS
ncbi:MAG: hypothetical protein IH987_00105 [Planctomycetes bacterium]|nr:hypothetical protein [Planctomycetota bacterium]